MIPNRDKAKGQALVEFTSNLIVRLFIAIIESDRHFQDWMTVQNSKGAAGRFTPTGQLETDRFFESSTYVHAGTDSVKDEALSNTDGLIVDCSHSGASYSVTIEAETSGRYRKAG